MLNREIDIPGAQFFQGGEPGDASVDPLGVAMTHSAIENLRVAQLAVPDAIVGQHLRHRDRRAAQ